MKGKEMTLMDWQKQYGTAEGCVEALIEQRWPEGFRCPYCGHDEGYVIIDPATRSLKLTQYLK